MAKKKPDRWAAVFIRARGEVHAHLKEIATEDMRPMWAVIEIGVKLYELERKRIGGPPPMPK